jgi:putative phosphoribosyl transferase
LQVPSKGGKVHLRSRLIYVPVGRDELQGSLNIPEKSTAIVIVGQAHSNIRHDSQNKYVAETLSEAGFATLLIDLLTPDEQLVEFQQGTADFDIDRLASRLSTVTQWLLGQDATKNMHVAYFAAGDDAAAALVCAAKHPERVEVIVCSGGRPTLVGPLLATVHAPTLLIAGAEDRVAVELNSQAASELRTEHRLEIILNAGQVFNEPGALETVAALTREWFEDHLTFGRRRAA